MFGRISEIIMPKNNKLSCIYYNLFLFRRRKPFELFEPVLDDVYVDYCLGTGFPKEISSDDKKRRI